jgi:hypothetical protein
MLAPCALGGRLPQLRIQRRGATLAAAEPIGGRPAAHRRRGRAPLLRVTVDSRPPLEQAERPCADEDGAHGRGPPLASALAGGDIVTVEPASDLAKAGSLCALAVDASYYLG